MIPTSTGSAKAIGNIFPELAGKLNGHAVWVTLLNASLSEFVIAAARPVTVTEVNDHFEAAAAGELNGTLGYKERPLISIDYVNDPRRRHRGLSDAPGKSSKQGKWGLCSIFLQVS